MLPRLVDLSEIADHLLLLATRLLRMIERQTYCADRRVVAHRQRSVPQPAT